MKRVEPVNHRSINRWLKLKMVFFCVMAVCALCLYVMLPIPSRHLHTHTHTHSQANMHIWERCCCLCGLMRMHVWALAHVCMYHSTTCSRFVCAWARQAYVWRASTALRYDGDGQSVVTYNRQNARAFHHTLTVYTGLQQHTHIHSMSTSINRQSNSIHFLACSDADRRSSSTLFQHRDLNTHTRAFTVLSQQQLSRRECFTCSMTV